MTSFLQTGKALYVLAVIYLAEVFIRLMTESFYKRLIKESTNMALTKNRYLHGLKQNVEDTYRTNREMDNICVYLERQIYSLRTFGMSVRGLNSLPGQLTLLCFLAGGGVVFLSYWFRSDNYCIVLCGTTSILAGMFTILVDYGVNLESRRQQLLIYLRDYLKDVMWPRTNREDTAERVPAVAAEEGRREPASLRSTEGGRCPNSSNRRGPGQTAASRERQEGRLKGDWLQGLDPEQKRMLGGLLRGFIS